LLASSTNWVVDLWNIDSKQRVTSFPGSVISASPDGRWIATAGGSQLQNEARMYEVSTGRLVQRFRGGHADEILSMDWSPDGLYLFTASANGKVRRWNTQNGQAEFLPTVEQ
jgi:WD40 repeat protein